jgi:hypothetical protein
VLGRGTAARCRCRSSHSRNADDTADLLDRIAGLAELPQGVGWGALCGGGLLAGIGFTMALFISGLALDGELLDSAKVGVLAGSAVAGVAGLACLAAVLPKPGSKPEPERAPA